MRRRERVQTIEEGLVRRQRVRCAEQLGHRTRPRLHVLRANHAPERSQAGRERQTVLQLRVVQRLDADRVTCEQEASAPRLVHRQREVPAQLWQQVLAVLCITSGEQRGITRVWCAPDALHQIAAMVQTSGKPDLEVDVRDATAELTRLPIGRVVGVECEPPVVPNDAVYRRVLLLRDGLLHVGNLTPVRENESSSPRLRNARPMFGYAAPAPGWALHVSAARSITWRKRRDGTRVPLVPFTFCGEARVKRMNILLIAGALTALALPLAGQTAAD